MYITRHVTRQKIASLHFCDSRVIVFLSQSHNGTTHSEFLILDLRWRLANLLRSSLFSICRLPRLFFCCPATSSDGMHDIKGQIFCPYSRLNMWSFDFFYQPSFGILHSKQVIVSVSQIELGVCRATSNIDIWIDCFLVVFAWFFFKNEYRVFQKERQK